jgi:hypothetical protein
MREFVNIINQFNVRQRMSVLILLLFFTSTTFIVTTFYKSGYNDCREIIDENRQLLRDYIIISKLIRESRVVEESYVDSSAVFTESPKDFIIPEEYYVMDSILTITESHID